MAIGVDSSKWKPRKMKGTPAYKFRNRLSYALVGIGALFGVAFQFGGFTSKMRNSFETLYSDPEEEIERKQLIINSLQLRTGDQLRRKMEEQSSPALPHK